MQAATQLILRASHVVYTAPFTSREQHPSLFHSKKPPNMKATGLSAWTGSWQGGTGTISTTTATFKGAPFSFSSRFHGTPGGSPEELLATALAGCFNQALANNLGMLGFEADTIETSVAIELGFGSDNFPNIFSISIVCEARIVGITKDDFGGCAERARTRCTIARLLKIDPHMIATLVT